MANRSKVDQIERERPGAYTRSDRVTSAEAERKNYQTTRPSEYTKSQAVLDAEAALKDYQAQRPGDYTKSQAVLDAEAAIKNYQAQRPGDYESQYGAQIDSLLEQIQNRKAFAYDFNADPLYQQYKNQYTKLGSDAAANAAAPSGREDGHADYHQGLDRERTAYRCRAGQPAVPDAAEQCDPRFVPGGL